MVNSLVIAVLTVVLTLAAAAMAAFVFAHVQLLRLDAFCYNYLLLGLMFPAATAILPLFIKIRDLGLLDTYWGVVLPQVAFGLGDEHPAVPQLLPPAAGRAVRRRADRRLRLHRASSATSRCRCRGRSSRRWA